MGRLTYTTQEVQDRLDSVGQMVRPNLLDNAYFIGGGSQSGSGKFPINQRGSTSYSGAANLFTIDRWKTSNANTTVSVSSSGLTISATSGSTPYLLQTIEDIGPLRGNKVTLSIMAGGTLYSASATIPSTDPSSVNTYCIITGFGHILYMAGAWYVRLTGATGGSNTFSAVKLELGSTQTLGHWDESTQAWVLNEKPNHQQELARCQRYFYRFDYHGTNYGTMFGKATSATSARVSLPLPVRMRTTPAISSKGQIRIEYNGSYALSSDYTIYATSDEGVVFAIASLSSGSLPGDGYPVYAFFNTETDTDLSADL